MEWATAARVAGTKKGPRAAVNPNMLDFCLKTFATTKQEKNTSATLLWTAKSKRHGGGWALAPVRYIYIYISADPLCVERVG